MIWPGLAFLNPLLLVGLLALPAIYWLLRAVPPRPQQINFPATRILVGLEAKEKTPIKTPWWLTLLRMLAAGFVILALADPVLNPSSDSALKGTGPVTIVVDNGWASGARWPERARLIDRLIAEAEAGNRAVMVVGTASATSTMTARIEPPGSARSSAAALQPLPFAPKRAAALDAITAALKGERNASVVWLSDGLEHDGKTASFVSELKALAGSGLSVIEAEAGSEALGLAAGLRADGKLEAVISRAGGVSREGIVQAFSSRNQRLGDVRFKLALGETRTTTTFELPLELRNQVTRLEIAGERSAGAVALIDARLAWNRIGVLSGESREEAQPLLGATYYIDRALKPFAELVHPKSSNVAAELDEILKQGATQIVLADIGTLTDAEKAKLDGFIRKGGVLVRFAGPRLEKGGDDLLPTPLRLGGRSLGGALSWSTPQPLAEFPKDSLFAGLRIPADVLVNRQVLADPARLKPEVKIWAALKDGTPLVTAAKLGEGEVVLFHVTANADWSNLALSGLFVDMLRRVSTLGRLSGPGLAAPAGSSADVAAPNGGLPVPVAGLTLSPFELLDGYGILKSPPPSAEPMSVTQMSELAPTFEHPPGYYGIPSAPHAFNILSADSSLKAMPQLPFGVERRAYEGKSAVPLKPHVLTTALALLFADVLAVLALQGAFQAVGNTLASLRRPARTLGIALLLAGLAQAGLSDTTYAQSAPREAPRARPQPLPGGSPFARDIFSPEAEESITIVPFTGKPLDMAAVKATRVVSFGYVTTGDKTTDETSRRGLSGLSRILKARTAVEPGEPTPINVTTDELAFYPVLYWPVLTNAVELPAAVLSKIDTYMKDGGLIVFDTRDYGQGVPANLTINSDSSGSRQGTPLQRLLGRLDIPRLEPVPDKHVLTKSFYLIRNFPGRWDGGQLWVEAEAASAEARGRQSRRSDGVSSILVTGNDFASAWALDEQNRPIYPCVPGGEAQREMAFRTGVNIAMYALTGNYKADQVHVPALLERLGQ